VENRKIMLLAPLVSLHNCGRVRAYLYFSDPVRDTAEKSVQETTLISPASQPAVLASETVLLASEE
jgi:hypothetical protein